MIDFFLSNNNIAVFLGQKKKTQIAAYAWGAFQIPEAVIFVNTSLKITLEGNFYLGACKANQLLRNLGYNNNSAQNQNAFESTARNLLGICSANIQFSNESVP